MSKSGNRIPPQSQSGSRAPRVNSPSTSKKEPVKLNSKFIEALAGGEMWWDDDPKAMGFGVRSYPGGGKSFFVDYRIEGRQRRFTIGPFPRWSVTAAREGGEGAPQTDRPGPRPGRPEAGAPGGADRPGPHRPLRCQRHFKSDPG